MRASRSAPSRSSSPPSPSSSPVKTILHPPNPVQSDRFAPLSHFAQVPLTLLTPPEPVVILTPSKTARRVLSFPRRRLRQTIVHWGGPWKIVDSTSLVDRPPLVRDYYQLETEDGRAYLVYWDRVTNNWFAQGTYE